MLKKKEKLTWADKTYGEVCPICKVRHVFIASQRTNLPKTGSMTCKAKVDKDIKRYKI